MKNARAKAIRLRQEEGGEIDADTVRHRKKGPELEESREHELPDEETDRTNRLPSPKI
jgi:hypothetical protein